MNLRKTKIICTLGPATDDDEVLRKLMIEGMDVARFNFSHGDHASTGRTRTEWRSFVRSLDFRLQHCLILRARR